MRKFLSEEAKQVIIKKVLSDNGQTMTEIALANNIGKSTLSEWVQRFKIENNIEPNLKSQSDESRTLVERFKHLQATFGQKDDMVGAYCRKHGLYPHQLTQWEADFMTKTIPEKQRSGTAEVKALHAEINSLKNIILRKDKVLAETVALLVLKKKAAQIWGGNEED
jgi:transposase-like protein